MKKIALLGLALAGVASAQAADIITNGDFETLPIGTGWVETGAPGIISDHAFSDFAGSGNVFAWLGGYDDADDWVSQTIDFGALAGTATFSFDMQIFDADDSGFDEFTVFIGGLEVDTIDIGDTAFAGFNPIVTKTYDMSFLMGSGVQGLDFRVTTDSSLDSSVFIDNVSLEITPVPEPATLGVLALAAIAARRRKR